VQFGLAGERDLAAVAAFLLETISPPKCFSIVRCDRCLASVSMTVVTPGAAPRQQHRGLDLGGRPGAVVIGNGSRAP